MGSETTRPASTAEVTGEHLEEIDALFVQNASSFVGSAETITLHGVSPSTLYFSDRPIREVGHMTLERFVDLWVEGSNSFEIDPPNAILSFVDRDGSPPEDVVLVLVDPRVERDALHYRVDVLEGEIPERGGPCVLFIDSFGRQLTPVSAAGIRRRERRRMRRRL